MAFLAAVSMTIGAGTGQARSELRKPFPECVIELTDIRATHRIPGLKDGSLYGNWRLSQAQPSGFSRPTIH